MNTNEVAKVYDTVLSIPGMNETVKLNIQISRKNILLLYRMIERGLSVEDNDSTLVDIFSVESIEELKKFSYECLKKAGLEDLSERLKDLDIK